MCTLCQRPYLQSSASIRPVPTERHPISHLSTVSFTDFDERLCECVFHHLGMLCRKKNHFTRAKKILGSRWAHSHLDLSLSLLERTQFLPESNDFWFYSNVEINAADFYFFAFERGLKGHFYISKNWRSYFEANYWKSTIKYCNRSALYCHLNVLIAEQFQLIDQQMLNHENRHILVNFFAENDGPLAMLFLAFLAMVCRGRFLCFYFCAQKFR